MTETVLLLIAAHCYGDFLLQPNGIVANKRKWEILAFHSVLHGLLAFLLLQQWGAWQIPLAVIGTHGLIDRIKLFFPSSPAGFALDQLAHLLSLAGIGYFGLRFGWIVVADAGVVGRDWILIGAGFCAAVLGAGFFISQVAGEMIEGNRELKDALGKGIQGGGARIGRLERALIFMFITIGHPAGIGFLIAAKSILRFEEAKQQNVSEYVLIGTLWSFGLAIAISWATFRAVTLFQ